MVLQREPAAAKLWGWGIPGTDVRVTAGDTVLQATVDRVTASWSVTLPPQKAGPAFGTGEITLETTFANASKNIKVVLTDMSYGEVWMCTGQSNMGLPLSAIGSGPSGGDPLTSWSGDVSYGAAEIANASAYPNIRVVQQQMVSIPDPTDHAQTSGGWFKPAPTNMGGFSAVCWMFGRRLQAELGVPVGLIQIEVGGTAVERWSSTDALAKCDQTRGPDKLALCKSSITPSDEALQYTRFGLDPHEHALSGPGGVNSTLFNGMINPWIGTAVKGAIWCVDMA